MEQQLSDTCSHLGCEGGTAVLRKVEQRNGDGGGGSMTPMRAGGGGTGGQHDTNEGGWGAA